MPMKEFIESLERDKKQTFQGFACQLPNLREGFKKTDDLKNEAGIYAFVKNGKIVYVGNTRNLKNRISGHRSTSVNRATFAVKLTREQLDMPATYKKGEGAKALVESNRNGFGDAFRANADKIKEMEVWFVKEESPVPRYLLEVYIHLKAGLPEKDFETS